MSVSRGLPLDERQSAAELEAVLQHHHNLQEKLADDMLNLARNLKNNTLAAQNIIKQDNQVTGQRHPAIRATPGFFKMCDSDNLFQSLPASLSAVNRSNSGRFVWIFYCPIVCSSSCTATVCSQEGSIRLII